MELLVVALVILICILIVVLIRRSSPGPQVGGQHAVLLMQQQVESLRHDLRESLRMISENVNRQLVLVSQQLESQTSTVGSRLDNATRVIGDVQRNLGELGEATREIKELGQSVSKLDELLRAPKLRGGLGEYMLEELLRQVLPAGHYGVQYQFRNGQIVDAVVHTSDRMVPIDSKFPLENFRRMVEASGENEQRQFRRSFIADVRHHIDDIAAKYILPDEGTFPFALMYIPAENIYYEVIIKDDGSNGSSLYSYALDRKVIPVSPNSFYAYLQVIAIGLRGLHVERSAQEILATLSRFQGEIGRLRETFDILGTHLDNARKKFEESNKRLTNFECRLENVVPYSLIEQNGRSGENDGGRVVI